MACMHHHHHHAPVYKAVTKEFLQASWHSSWLDEGFMRIHAMAKKGSTATDIVNSGLMTEVSKDIYSFPFLKKEVCKMILTEVESFKTFCYDNDVEISRPNSMNNYGLVLSQMGMRQCLNALQKEYLLPVSRVLFPVVASEFTSHHSFIVSYELNKDRHLDMHTDDSDITWNICLGDEGFTGSGLTFCGMRGDPSHRKHTLNYQHQIGRAVVHYGEQRHGADNIASGSRHNLIIWNKNEAYRQSPAYQMKMREYLPEAGSPDPQCLSYTHDRDFVVFKDYPSAEKNPYLDLDLEGDEDGPKARKVVPWCPPRGLEYPGFPSNDRIMGVLAKKKKEEEYLKGMEEEEEEREEREDRKEVGEEHFKSVEGEAKESESDAGKKE